MADSWGDVFNRYLARGHDHGSAAYAADEWERRKGSLIPIAPDARVSKPPCGECHLHDDETCDICGAKKDQSNGNQ